MMIIVLLCMGGVCVANQPGEVAMKTGDQTNEAARTEIAVLGSGCFWCTEAVYQRIAGVIRVAPGYMGGKVRNPTYEQVCRGDTGHAEVARIEFDPRKVSYVRLLETFWESHDPTTLNRQGADVGTQYRSVIFYLTSEQKAAAESSRAALAQSAKHKDPIVTEIVAAGEFYAAEDYHANYYNANKGAPYCRFIIRPKLKKLGLTE